MIPMAKKEKPAPLPPPTPAPTRRVGRLDHVAGVTRELARLYRDVRAGRVSSSDGARMGYLLSVIRQTIETGELAARLEAIETEISEGKTDAAA